MGFHWEHFKLFPSLYQNLFDCIPHLKSTAELLSINLGAKKYGFNLLVDRLHIQKYVVLYIDPKEKNIHIFVP